MSEPRILVWRPDLQETPETGAELRSAACGRVAAIAAAQEDADSRYAADSATLAAYEDGVEVMVRTSDGVEHRLLLVAEVTVVFRAEHD